MTPLAFYQVQETTPAAVDAVLPALLQKACAKTPVLLVAPTAARCQRLDEGLWGGLGTLGPSSFLPHATPVKGRAAQQPILLVNLEEETDLAPYQHAHLGPAPQPRLPVVLAGAESALPNLLQATPPKVCYLFSAAPAETERARALYRTAKAEGRTLQYFLQEAGRWAQK